MAMDGAGGGGRRWGRRVAVWAVVTAGLLCVPLTAMQFTKEVNWTLFDFVFAGVLIFGVAIAYELAAWNGSLAYRAAAGVALATAFFMIWANGAVGLVGNEGDAVNALFAGVLVVGGLGALVARFRADGMARALVVTALAQGAVAVIAVSTGLVAVGPTWPRELVLVTAVFSCLWLLSAGLFRVAAGRRGAA